MIAYVLIRRANAGFIPNMQARSDVDYASATTGPFAGLVKVRVGSGQALQAFLSGPLVAGGALDYESAVAVRLGPYAPKIKIPPPQPPPPPPSPPYIEAAVLIRTEPGRAFVVLHDLDSVPGVCGTATVAGSFDVLAIAYATSADSLTHVIGTINAVDGVASTQTLLLLDADGADLAFAVAGEAITDDGSTVIEVEAETEVIEAEGL